MLRILGRLMNLLLLVGMMVTGWGAWTAHLAAQAGRSWSFLPGRSVGPSTAAHSQWLLAAITVAGLVVLVWSLLHDRKTA